jgi:hypothetical protein
VLPDWELSYISWKQRFQIEVFSACFEQGPYFGVCMEKLWLEEKVIVTEFLSPEDLTIQRELSEQFFSIRALYLV